MEKEDRVWIADYLAGNDAALTSLVNRHVKSVYNFAYHRANNPSIAEDITQETFIKAWKHLHTFRLNENFHAWLFAIARNTAIDHLRKKKTFSFSLLSRKHDNGDAYAFEETLIDTEPTPEELAIVREQNEDLDDALAMISPSHREVLLLYYNEDLTFREIGMVLGEPLNTVKSRYRRALILLREKLNGKRSST